MAQPQPFAHYGLALPMDLSPVVPIPFFDPPEDVGHAFLGCFSLFFPTSSFLTLHPFPLIFLSIASSNQLLGLAGLN